MPYFGIYKVPIEMNSFLRIKTHSRAVRLCGWLFRHTKKTISKKSKRLQGRFVKIFLIAWRSFILRVADSKGCTYIILIRTLEWKVLTYDQGRLSFWVGIRFQIKWIIRINTYLLISQIYKIMLKTFSVSRISPLFYFLCCHIPL